MRVSAREEQYESVELFGRLALFTNSRIQTDSVPDGWYCYDLRGSDTNPNEPVTVEPMVAVNHDGTILSPELVTIPKEGFRRLRGRMNFLGEHLSLADFREVRCLNYPADNQKYVLRPASASEAGLFYTSTPEKDAELGCMGHVRMDFGNGKEFWHTWWPRGDEALNSPEFKQELGEVVDAMRKSVLKDLQSMSNCCYEHGGTLGADSRQYGYVVETRNYRYGLRCNPQPGDYQAYLICFDLRQQKLQQEPPIVGKVSFASGETLTYYDFEELSSLLSPESTLYELNALVQKLSELDERQRISFKGLLQMEVEKRRGPIQMSGSLTLPTRSLAYECTDCRIPQLMGAFEMGGSVEAVNVFAERLFAMTEKEMLHYDH